MKDLGAVICVAIPIVIVISIVIIAGLVAESRRKALEAARAVYQEAITNLKAAPTDSNLRQLALEAGREYASRSRENKGSSIFDEVALKNDLDAATAGAVSIAATATLATPMTSVADRLRQLDDLRNQGLITDEEYQARRMKILEGV